jgi:alpha-galactosidase
MMLVGVGLAVSAAANHNAVGQLPVMGWSGYLAFLQGSGHCATAGASGYNETLFLETSAALEATGLKSLGYVYLNVDDCWLAENRTTDGKLTADTSRFPHGMAWLADQAHERGFKLGLYAAASLKTCRKYPGSQGYEAVDAETFAGFGADFVKLDSCGNWALASGPESWAHQYGKWSRALNATGRQIVFSCSWALYYDVCVEHQGAETCGVVPWKGGKGKAGDKHDDDIRDICHMWRYGADLHPVWAHPEPNPGGGGGGVGDIIRFASSSWAADYRTISGRGAVNDPDFLAVGCPTGGPCAPFSHAASGSPSHNTDAVLRADAGLSDVEQRTQMSLWCILAAPLIIGSDVRRLSATALATLSNKLAIAINQDPALNLPFQPAWVDVSPPAVSGREAVDVVVWARALESRPAASSPLSTRSAESASASGQTWRRRVAVSVTNMATTTQPGPQPPVSPPPVSVTISARALGLGKSEGCTWPGTLKDVWRGTTVVLGNGTSSDPAVVVDQIPWHATRLLVVEVVCAEKRRGTPLAAPLEGGDATGAPPPLAPPSNRTVSVWWKPHSLAGLASEVRALRSTLSATDVLIYCGYAALPNGSFGVSPNAAQQTWGNVSLCAAAVQQATRSGLRSKIMVEGRATLGFEAAVQRGGAAFGAEMAAQIGTLTSRGQGRKPHHHSHSDAPGLRGFCFDFEHKAGTHGRVNVSAKAYAGFLRTIGSSLPHGLQVTVAAATGWPFMSNFSLLLSDRPGGGNAAALFDMGLYHATNATQWVAQLDAALANAAGTMAAEGRGEGAAVPPSASVVTGSADGATAFGAGLSLRAGQSPWEGTPTSVGDRFRALEDRGVNSVAVFEFTHAGLPKGLAPAMIAAWTAALRAFVAKGGRTLSAVKGRPRART